MDVTLIPLPRTVGEHHVIRGIRCLIGRGDDCDLQIDHRMVSRHHAELLMEEDSLRVRDLQSLNGTFVNGEEIDGECVLEDGAVITFGMASFQVRINRSLADRVQHFFGRRSGHAALSP